MPPTKLMAEWSVSEVLHLMLHKPGGTAEQWTSPQGASCPLCGQNGETIQHLRASLSALKGQMNVLESQKASLQAAAQTRAAEARPSCCRCHPCLQAFTTIRMSRVQS